jgi:hypothetical protein
MKQLNKFLSAVFLAVSLGTVVGCASTSQQEGTGEYVDDAVITTKVKAAIFNEPTLKSAEINVETFKGAVQLSGFVNSQADINKAVEVARSVKGVTSVKNDMRVKWTIAEHRQPVPGIPVRELGLDSLSWPRLGTWAPEFWRVDGSLGAIVWQF